MIYFVGERIDYEGIRNASLKDLTEFLRGIKEVGFDTETTGYDAHTCKLLCYQLGNIKDQFVVEVVDEESLRPLRKLSERDDITILGQNLKFDLKFLYHHKIYLKKLYDTFLAELILQTGLESEDQHVALDDLAWKYCDVKLDKGIRGVINREGLTPRVIKYAAEDTQYLSLIKEKQLEQINWYALNEILDLENEVTKVFALMEYNGIHIDKNKWLEVAKITSSEKKRLESELDNLVLNEPKLNKFVPKARQINLFGFEERIMDINWGSSQQKLDIINALGIKESSVGERILQRHKKEHKLIATLINYNKQRKLNDAFGEAFLDHINKVTNKVHMDIWPIVSTGRLSVSKPNLNQIPSKGDLGKTIRSCFIPERGYKIVGADYSGMELRIIAEYSQDPVWLKAFRDNKDLHSELCALTFGIDIKDVKKPFPPKPDLTYRDVQKTVDFMLAYGGSEFKLSDVIQVPVDEAKDIIRKFFSVVPKVESFLNAIGESGKKNGFIKTGPVLQRIRWFPQWQQTKDLNNPKRLKILGEIERASKNTPFQGTNASIIKVALINVQKEIDTNKWPVNILLSVYDEIVCECREDLAEDWAKMLERIMIQSAEVAIKTIPVVVDCKVSNYWQK
jgi:DNA polymerase-1